MKVNSLLHDRLRCIATRVIDRLWCIDASRIMYRGRRLNASASFLTRSWSFPHLHSVPLEMIMLDYGSILHFFCFFFFQRDIIFNA